MICSLTQTFREHPGSVKADFEPKAVEQSCYGYNVEPKRARKRLKGDFSYDMVLKRNGENGREGSRRLSGPQTGRGEAQIGTKGLTCLSAQRLTPPFYDLRRNGRQKHAVDSRLDHTLLFDDQYLL